MVIISYLVHISSVCMVIISYLVHICRVCMVIISYLVHISRVCMVIISYLVHMQCICGCRRKDAGVSLTPGYSTCQHGGGGFYASVETFLGCSLLLPLGQCILAENSYVFGVERNVNLLHIVHKEEICL